MPVPRHRPGYPWEHKKAIGSGELQATAQGQPRSFGMRLRTVILLAAAAIAVVGALPNALVHAVESPRNRVDYYVNRFSVVDRTTSPTVQRAYDVFVQVRAVADKKSVRLPQLKIVEGGSDPWAVSLPDGFIVLSRRAVETCYEGVPVDEGDARMAFLIGHELAHMAQDDFWQMNAYMASSEDIQGAEQQKTVDKSANAREAEQEKELSQILGRETKADEEGFLYAALAGYKADVLVGEGKDDLDFFTFWVSRMDHAGTDKKHPAPAERAQQLICRLSELRKKVDYFRFGACLAHFQRYQDALYFFREIQRSFASREVYNNLGYCHLQMAFRELDPATACHYWLPAALDDSTRAESFRIRGKGEGYKGRASEPARQHLETAVEYLKKACEMDSGYAPSRTNLAIAHFLLGPDHIFEARAKVEEALRIAPEDPEVQAFKGLIVMHQSLDADIWPNVTDLLERITATPNAPLSLRYNLAVLLDERGRTGKADEIWSALASQGASLPEPYRDIVVKRAGFAASTDGPAGNTAPKAPYSLPVPVGLDLTQKQQRDLVFSGWESVAFDFQKSQEGELTAIPGESLKLAGYLYWKPEKASVLVLDDYVEMVVLRGDDLGTADALRSRCGEPASVRSVTGGAIWSFGPQWAALVRGDQVAEIWVARR